MNKKTKGSWLVHHTNKLQAVTSQTEHEQIFLAGKAGILLSAMSSNNELMISKERLSALARASNINKLELPGILDVLAEQGVVDTSSEEVAVLGVTTSSVLDHTATIYDALGPSNSENACIFLAEQASQAPQADYQISELIGDTFKLDKSSAKQVLEESAEIGFVDAEAISESERLYFNGNLFRRDDTAKIKSVLDSLNSSEEMKIVELNAQLRSTACVTIQAAKKGLGENLFQKVTAVGLYDISVVSNDSEEVGYVTMPSAFCKYSNALEEDAFDLAKAFVSSITYGMTKSTHERGQIRLVEALIRALIRGESVGPVRAIGQDYKVLEMKGVVQVAHGSKKGRSGPMMRLLKKEVGELALQVIKKGDASEHSLDSFPSAAVTRFRGPERNRETERRKQKAESPRATNDILSSLRSGSI